MELQNETKEVAVVREKLGNAQAAAEAMAKTIKSDADYEKASEMLVNIKKVGRLITQEKKKQTDPLNQALKATREFWRPFEDQYAKAEKVLKDAVLKYKKKVDTRNEKKEATISKKVDEGSMTFEKGVEKMSEVQTPTTHAGVQTRKVRKVRFADLSTLRSEDITVLISKGFIQWDTVAARKAALAGTDIPGAEVYEDEVVAA